MTKLKVFIVDDDVMITKMLKRMLELMDEFEVSTVNNPDQAIEKMEAYAPDIALIDVEMDEKPGPILVEEIKKHPQLAAMPIIFISGLLASDCIAEVCEKYGIDIPAGGKPFLHKPFTPEALLHEILLRFPSFPQPA